MIPVHLNYHNKSMGKDRLSTTTSGLPLTISYTRKLLGEEAIGLSDREIILIIEQLDFLSELMIDIYKVHKTEKA